MDSMDFVHCFHGLSTDGLVDSEPYFMLWFFGACHTKAKIPLLLFFLHYTSLNILHSDMTIGVDWDVKQ